MYVCMYINKIYKKYKKEKKKLRKYPPTKNNNNNKKICRNELNVQKMNEKIKITATTTTTKKNAVSASLENKQN